MKENDKNINEKYRGRMCGILLEPDIMRETDELRGEIPRSKYINEALRAHNQRIAILKQKIAELEKDIQKMKNRSWP